MVDELLIDFIAETKENLALVDVQLVRLESVPDDATVLADIFRLVHTIKGSSGFVGLQRLGNVAHAAENILGSVRDEHLLATPQLVTAILHTLDRIREIICSLDEHGIEPIADDTDIIDQLASVAQLKTATPDAPSPAIADSAEFSRARDANADRPEITAEASAAFVSQNQTVRVPVRVLDQLMDLVSELVLTRNQLVQIASTSTDSDFDAPVQRLSQCTSQLQEGLMRTRLQPIAQAWAQLPRIVRDLAFDLGNRVTLQLSGEDTGFDRQVMELIKDPLIHMVRNAVDHGIEMPQDRVASGKSEAGHIHLHAAQEGGFIFIRMRDDGRGLQLERLKHKAVQAGVLTEADAATMTPAQAHKLIFHAGLSTTDTTTSVSGRGVGMDVVKANIERIGGTIEIESTPGQGSEFIIKIPLTLAIISALLVQSGPEKFAFPQSAALELIRVGSDSDYQISHIQNARTLRWRDELVTLADLHDALELPARPALDAETPAADQFVILTKIGTRTIGLIVDEIFDTQEIVVKPLSAIANRQGLYSGATILGDGRVIVILSPDGIAEKSGLGSLSLHSQLVADPQAAPEADRRTQMLLVKSTSDTLAAVPLEAVTRIDDIARDRIEYANGAPVLQIGNQQVPLLLIDPGISLVGAGSVPVILFSHAGTSFGLVVRAIVDVVNEVLSIAPVAIGSGFIGTAVLQGRVTNIIDLAHYYARIYKPAAVHSRSVPEARQRPALLVIDESRFFRTLMRPLLESAGYTVEAVASLAEAQKISASHGGFDIILSDVEGLSAADVADLAALRGAKGPNPARLVALALDEDSLARMAPLGTPFDDWALKMDSSALLETLTRQVRATARQA